jgi:hypothetical protein
MVEDEDTSPEGLWEDAKYLLQCLFGLYGRSETIAAVGPVASKTHHEISSWLAAVERIVRRLLIVEAAKLVKSLPAIVKRANPRTSQREPQRFEQDPRDSTKWRVSFRAVVTQRGRVDRSETSAAADSANHPLKGTGLHAMWPVAERIEAVRRVLKDPAPYAARLARRLRGKPMLAAAIVRPERGSEDETLGKWAYGHALSHAGRAVEAFDTS